MRYCWLYFRTGVFYLTYTGFTTLFSLMAITFVPLLPYKKRLTIILLWNKFVLLTAKLICGIDYRIHGLDNIPKGAYVVLAKHQSAWETFLLVLLLKPISIILKQELLKIPGFGWGLRLLKPIPIDRSNPRAALRSIRKIGLKRLQEEEIPILVFPEGTRTALGESGRYARSGAALAIEAQVPVIFIAHNAGYFWPTSHRLKYPGTIDVFISKAVDTQGREAAELTKEAETWIESHVLVPEHQPIHLK